MTIYYTSSRIEQLQLSLRKNPMNKVAIVQFARLTSERVPEKMLRPVGGATLIDRALRYYTSLVSLRKNVTVFLIIPDSDAELARLAEPYLSDSIKLRFLTEEQSSCRIWSDLIKPFIHELSSYDWVWDANIACHPLLKLQTGLDIIDNLQADLPKGPKVWCIAERNPLWDSTGKMLYNIGQLADTTLNEFYLKPSHIAHCYPPECLDWDEERLANSLWPVIHNLTDEEKIDIDTSDDLQLARHVAAADRQHYAMPELEAIVFGTGPSFYQFIGGNDGRSGNWLPRYKTHRDSGSPSITDSANPNCFVPAGTEWSPSLYGCGVVPNYINGLRYYCYGDLVHCDNVPDGRPTDPFHPGCITYTGDRNMRDGRSKGGYMPPMLRYSDLDIPHGESSGGMALSLAALHHNIIGLVGFDGDTKSFKDKAVYKNFVFKFRVLLNYWQNRGRRFINLMPPGVSIFEDIIEPNIDPVDLHPNVRPIGDVV